MRCMLPITHKHGPRSIVVKAVKLLNDLKWTKDSGKSKDAFKVEAKRHILQHYANKNIK